MWEGREEGEREGRREGGRVVRESDISYFWLYYILRRKGRQQKCCHARFLSEGQEADVLGKPHWMQQQSLAASHNVF